MRRKLSLVFSAITLIAAGCSGSVNDSAAQAGADETVHVQPGQQSGTIQVDAPAGATLPDWSGSSPYGLGYSATAFHVLTATNTKVSDGVIGGSVNVPHGTYKIVINDTVATVTVTAKQTTEIQASRIEVADVSGSFTLSANSPSATYSGYSILAATFPTGVGLNVISGDYTANVSYQSAQKSQSAKVAAGQTVLVQPADLRGNIVVTAPTSSLPDWSGSSPYGLGYDNNTVHVLTFTNTKVADAKLGQAVAVPEGSYKLVLNDTVMNVSVTRQQTLTIYGGRIEVDTTDVTGNYTVSAVSPSATYSGYSVLAATFPLGVGFNVLPGSYQVNVNYDFGGNDTFPITVDNTP
jgi:hypothetical protein